VETGEGYLTECLDSKEENWDEEDLEIERKRKMNVQECPTYTCIQQS
jgi:hypothetical protein